MAVTKKTAAKKPAATKKTTKTAKPATNHCTTAELTIGSTTYFFNFDILIYSPLTY